MSENVAASEVLTKEQQLYDLRLERVNKAIALEEPDRVPVCPFFASYMQRSEGSSYRDLFYDYEAAGEAALRFYAKHPQCDVTMYPGSTSGISNEIAGSTMIDWPGRPGTMVSDYSSHQVIEHEYLLEDEYPELLRDFTGFMIRKYIPRAYSNITGTKGLELVPTVVLSTSLLAPFTSPEFLGAIETMKRIAEEDRKCAEVSARYTNKLHEMGFPSMYTNVSEAPYDILGDYFRGTMGIFEDLMEREDEIDAVCDMFADMQIERLKVTKNFPVRRVNFPLHKGMDGFMSEEQYERFYWKPLRKIVMALIDMDITPCLYGEGPYDSRLHFFTDLPKGKVLVHLEKVDMKEAKRILGDTCCIIGNLSVSRMEFGTKEQIINMTKHLLDTCAPGGGYIFDFDGSLENARPENVDAMFETLDKYGKY